MDINIIVRAIGNWNSPSGIIVKQCQAAHFRLLLSKSVLAEYRRVLNYGRIVRPHPKTTAATMENVLGSLRYISEFPSTHGVIFRYDRDPTDEKFIELAIAGSAECIVTRDLDLLALVNDHSDAAKRFRRHLPATRILRPEHFLAEWNN